MEKYLIIDIALISTHAFLWIGYHILLALTVRFRPLYTTQGMNNVVRKQWIYWIMKNTASNAILAVQTMRNIITAGSFLSTVSITLGLAFLNYSLGSNNMSKYAYLGSKDTNLVFVKIMLMFLCMIFSFFNFVICIRNLNHATNLVSLPPEARRLVLMTEAEVSPKNAAHVYNRGMLHFTLGMRGYYILVPFVLWIFGPVFMFVSSCIMLALLVMLDKAAIMKIKPKREKPVLKVETEAQQQQRGNAPDLGGGEREIQIELEATTV